MAADRFEAEVTRIGVMGGTFDPIHHGHLVAAEEAWFQYDLDVVLFMVAGRPALKPVGVSDPETRFAMATLACAGNPHFEVSRLEIDRPGVTYTVDTIRALRDLYGSEADIYFITGTDAVFEILEWHDAAQLADLVKFIAAGRPGYDYTSALEDHADVATTFDLSFMEVPALAISSTDIRDRARDDRPYRYLVPREVAAYIAEHGMYKEGGHIGVPAVSATERRGER